MFGFHDEVKVVQNVINYNGPITDILVKQTNKPPFEAAFLLFDPRLAGDVHGLLLA